MVFYVLHKTGARIRIIIEDGRTWDTSKNTNFFKSPLAKSFHALFKLHHIKIKNPMVYGVLKCFVFGVNLNAHSAYLPVRIQGLSRRD